MATTDPMSDQQAQELTPAEREALFAAWRAYRMSRRERDGIRPRARVDGRSYEAGWLDCRAYLARPVQVERPDERPAEDDDVALIAGIEDDDSLGPHQGMIDADEGSR